MRAIFLENLTNMLNDSVDEIEIIGESAIHLIKVLRIKVKDALIGLDGLGTRYSLEVTTIKRSSIICKILNSTTEERKEVVDLAIGQTKKDALDLILKQSCELGIRKIRILSTEYSQRYPINLGRVKKLLQSGLEQSNNLFLPQVEIIPNILEIDHQNYANLFFFSSIRDGDKNTNLDFGPSLFVIGPEGGFSESEEDYFRNLENCKTFMLNTYILRSPTAFSAAIGFYLGLKS